MASETVPLDTEPIDGGLEGRERAPIPISEVDLVLTAQLVVGWAGEGGEEPRLGWWRSDLASEFGGEDLFRRLLPHTWQWAILQSVREAAYRKDAELRAQSHDADRILSLFNFGFAVDERVDERLQQLKGTGRPPLELLPGLADGISSEWSRERFLDWIEGHGNAKNSVTSIGRHIQGSVPPTLDHQLRQLVSALSPIADRYPLPHYRMES